MGKRTIYTQKQINQFKDIIIDKLWEGNSLRKILRTNKNLPSRRYVYEWLNPNHERFDQNFSNHYIRVREEIADDFVDRIAEITNKMLKGKIEPHAARVAIDSLKWTSGRMKPRKYGTTKFDLTTDGKEIQNQIVTYFIPDNGRDNLIDPDEDYNPENLDD